MILVTQFIKSNSILSMLTQQSFVAIDRFLPFIQPMKAILQPFYQHLDSQQVTFQITKDSRYQKKVSIQSLENEHFIDSHLKVEITKLSSCREVHFTTPKTQFTLKFHGKDESLDRLLPHLAYALTLTTLLSPHKVKRVMIHYYLLDSKRVTDNDNHFDKEEVNGGTCWSSPEECEFTVWRKEELLKVSIHELIHGLSYDYKQDTQDIVRHYQQKYDVTSTKMNTFEAYTEIFAELIHCYVLAKLGNQAIPRVKAFTLFQAYVGLEHQFSELQASKVLRLRDKDADVNKHTNVLAYYVIKLELYRDLKGFLHYCQTHNQSFLKITDTDRYFDYLKQLQKIKIKEYKVTGYLEITTRMTCLELNLFT